MATSSDRTDGYQSSAESDSVDLAIDDGTERSSPPKRKQKRLASTDIDHAMPPRKRWLVESMLRIEDTLVCVGSYSHRNDSNPNERQETNFISETHDKHDAQSDIAGSRVDSGEDSGVYSSETTKTLFSVNKTLSRVTKKVEDVNTSSEIQHLTTLSTPKSANSRLSPIQFNQSSGSDSSPRNDDKEELLRADSRLITQYQFYLRLVLHRCLSEAHRFDNTHNFEIPVPEAYQYDPDFVALPEIEIVKILPWWNLSLLNGVTLLTRILAEKRVFGPKMMSKCIYSCDNCLPIYGLQYIENVCYRVCCPPIIKRDYFASNYFLSALKSLNDRCIQLKEILEKIPDYVKTSNLQMVKTINQAEKKASQT